MTDRTITQGREMVQPDSAANREQAIDTMAGLMRLSTFHRAIAASGEYGTVSLSSGGADSFA